MKQREWLWLALILLLACILRLTNLSHLPPGLYLDEVLYGLDAYSIIKTGKDIYGHFLPLTFQSSGYYPSIFTYILAPFFLVFPLTAWVVRLPASLSGIASVLLTYLLVKKLFSSTRVGLLQSRGSDPNGTIALLSVALLALSPWHVHLSRVAFLGSFGISFLVLGIYLFISGYPTLSLIIFGLSTHVHYGYKLLAPALFVILSLIYHKRPRLIAYFIVLVLIISHLISIHYYNALFRVNELSVTSLPQIFHQYLIALSPQFLFIRGDHNLLLNPWGRGELPFSFAPLLLVGLFNLKHLPFPRRAIILSWLLLTPIPSALAGLGDHAVRNSPLLIPLVIIAALGLAHWHHWSKYILFIALIIETFTAFRFYAQIYPVKSAYLWGEPERQLIHQAINSPTPTVIADTFSVRFSFFAFMTQLNPTVMQTIINQPVKQIGKLQFVDSLNH